MTRSHARQGAVDKGAKAVCLSLVVSTMLVLGGCGGSPKKGDLVVDGGSGLPDAVPKVEPKSRYGNMQSYVVFGKTYHTKASSRGHVERGIASWYGPKFHGRKTSSGEPYDMHQMTAAHKTLPLPTYARVTNLENGRSAIVKINDRGPFVGNRIIDLSYAAAKKLGVDKQGLARVEVASIDPRDHGGKLPSHSRLAGGQKQNDKPVRTPSPVAQPRQAPESFASISAEPAKGALASGGRSGEAGLYLQVGAFGTRDNAEQMRRRLTSMLQDPVQVREATGASAALYKVRVGPVSTRSDADSLSLKLASLGVDKPILVQD
jgi:rare lipoprotein A